MKMEILRLREEETASPGLSHRWASGILFAPVDASGVGVTCMDSRFELSAPTMSRVKHVDHLREDLQLSRPTLFHHFLSFFPPHIV